MTDGDRPAPTGLLHHGSSLRSAYLQWWTTPSHQEIGDLVLGQSAIFAGALAHSRGTGVNLPLTENHRERHAIGVRTMDT